MTEKEKFLSEKVNELTSAASDQKCHALVLITGDGEEENQGMLLVGVQGNSGEIAQGLAVLIEKNKDLGEIITSAVTMAKMRKLIKSFGKSILEENK